MKRLMILVVMVFWPVVACSSVGMTAPYWVGVEGDTVISSPKVSISHQDRGSVSVTVVVPGFSIERFPTAKGFSACLSFPGQGFGGKPGEARLPAIRLLIEIPHDAETLYGIEADDVVEYELDTLGMSDGIGPVQHPHPKSIASDTEWGFVKDMDYYASDEFLPAHPVVIENIFFIRGHRLARVLVSPLTYNPVRDVIRVAKTMSVRFRFDGGNLEKTLREIARSRSLSFEANLGSLVLNYGAFNDQGRQTNPRLDSGEGLLIVSAPDFYEHARSLAAWRSQMGYRVSHVTTAQTGTTVEAIKAYLSTVYDEWSSPALSFVMLVGDVDSIPAPGGTFCGGCASDSDYACIVGDDNVPDIYLGRVSVETALEASRVFERFLNYSRAVFSQEAWIKKACFASSCDSIYNNYSTHERCLSDYTLPHGYSGTYYPPGPDPGGDLIRCIEDYDGHGENAGDAVLSALTMGRALITYSGHSWEYGWKGPTVDVHDLIDIDPGASIPFMVGHSCYSQMITHSLPCFGEVALRNVAIGYFGSSAGSYWGEDDYLQRAWYARIFEHNQLRLGEFITNGLIDMYVNYNSSRLNYYMDMEILGGDPTMALYTEIPRSSTVTHAGTIVVDQTDYEVMVSEDGDPIDGAWVCLQGVGDLEEVRAFGVTDSLGYVDLTMASPPAIVGMCRLTVTAPNARPLVAEVHVIPASGPWPVFQSCRIEDIAGNADGMPNPGETIRLPVTLRNVGQVSIGSFLASVESTSPYITILDGSAEFPAIAPSENAESSPDHVLFMISPLTPNGTSIIFTLTWSAPGELIGTTTWFLTVVTPVLTFEGYIVDDGPLGNGHLDAGETARLVLRMKNDGGIDLQGIRGVLMTLSPFLDVLDNAAEWSDLTQGSDANTLEPHFTIMAHPDIPAGHRLDLQLVVTADKGYSTICAFSLPSGLTGSVLVIDDHSEGTAAMIATTLRRLSREVREEPASTTDPSTWSAYDFIVHSSGGNLKPVQRLASAMITYVGSGGRLLLEGGEVLAVMSIQDPVFMNEVMHCTKWNNHKGENFRLYHSIHPVSITPRRLPVIMTHTFDTDVDQDQGTARSDAVRVYTWSWAPSKAGIIAFDNDSDPDNGGQKVICTFDMAKMGNDNGNRDHLIENMAHWLTPGVQPPEEVPTTSAFAAFVLLMLMAILLVPHRRRGSEDDITSRFVP